MKVYAIEHHYRDGNGMRIKAQRILIANGVVHYWLDYHSLDGKIGHGTIDLDKVVRITIVPFEEPCYDHEVQGAIDFIQTAIDAVASADKTQALTTGLQALSEAKKILEVYS